MAPEAGPARPACEIRVTIDGQTTTRLSSQQWFPSLRANILKQEGVEAVELVREISREEYLARVVHERAKGGRKGGRKKKRPAPDPAPALPPRPRPEPFDRPGWYRARDVRHAASEILATFDDGRAVRQVVRRASVRRSIREYQAKTGIRSVEVVRKLTMAEWQSEQPGKLRPRPPKPPKVPTPPAVSVSGWEVLIRQGGKTRTIRVACSTEDVALSLGLAIDGVDGAVAIRPLTAEQFRESAR